MAMFPCSQNPWEALIVKGYTLSRKIVENIGGRSVSILRLMILSNGIVFKFVFTCNGCCAIGECPVVSCSYADCWETTLKPCGLIDSLVSRGVR